MNFVDEVIDLTQRLASVLDDTGTGIVSVNLERVTGQVTCHCTLKIFIQNFSTYDIVELECANRYPFEFRTEQEGVLFLALADQDEVKQIKNPSALACE